MFCCNIPYYLLLRKSEIPILQFLHQPRVEIFACVPANSVVDMANHPTMLVQILSPYDHVVPAVIAHHLASGLTSLGSDRYVYPSSSTLGAFVYKLVEASKLADDRH